MNKLITGLIMGLVIGLIIGLSIGYFTSTLINRPNFMRDNQNFMRNNTFQISDDEKSSIISFFNNSNLEEINSYCQENRMYCAYYCREINPEHEACSLMQIPVGGGR